MSDTETRIVQDRSYKRRAIIAEIGRRKNNKKRKAEGDLRKVRAASWVFRGLTAPNLQSLLDGETVAVEFKNRTVNVSIED